MPFAGYSDFDECVRKNSDKSDPKAYCASIERKVKEDFQVTELLDAEEAEFNVDETTGKMTGRVTIIKAGRAKNPRNYRSSALRKAAKEGVYNGVRMFVNHSDKPPIKRGFGEMVAAVESTEYDPKTDSIRGDVVFFDKEFFERAQHAKKYVGVSASHRIRVTHAQEGSRMIEDVQEIVAAHSVDWVIYPSAGGEILSFARESEGADEVEWSDITLDQLKTNAPQLLEEFKASLPVVKEAVDPDPEPPDGEKITAADVKKMVDEQVAAITAKMAADNEAKAASDKKLRDYVSKSGLPVRTQNRLINQFAGVNVFEEETVKEAVEEAKAELKEAGAGPKIVGLGPTAGPSAPEKGRTISAMEAVDNFFGMGKKPVAATPEES